MLYGLLLGKLANAMHRSGRMKAAAAALAVATLGTLHSGCDEITLTYARLFCFRPLAPHGSAY